MCDNSECKMKFFNIGDASADGRVEIIDEDKLCYQVKNISKGAIGIRTISKKLLFKIDCFNFYKSFLAEFLMTT